MSSRGVAVDGTARDEVLARGTFSDVSRMALDIAAVLPLRRASTIRYLRMDCSRDVPFSLGTMLARAGFAEGGGML